MRFEHPPTAMHVITRPKLGGAIEHDAILRQTRYGQHVIELHPQWGLRVREHREVACDEGFVIKSTVPDVHLHAADERLRRLLERPPTYSATSFNCQHFASEVTSGRKQSRDLNSAKTAGAVAAGALAMGLAVRWLWSRASHSV